MPRILVVDDDPQIRGALGVTLPLQWHSATVIMASTGEEALRLFAEQEPAVVVLDVSLPGLSGFEVLRQIRLVSDIPVIMLTGRGDEIDQVRGFGLGADDYVVKPFGSLALIARIKAVLRRTGLSPLARSGPDFRAGPLTISFDSRQVAVHGQILHLTPIEHKLLELLARNAGHVLTHDALLNRLWGPDAFRTTDHLRVCVSRLQAKIERPGGPRCIENEHGLGYRLVRPTAAGEISAHGGAPIGHGAQNPRQHPTCSRRESAMQGLVSTPS
jgi:two-component system, OmpR family, KDP operon response regulator KdpE